MIILDLSLLRLGSGKPQNLIIDDGKESDEDETFVVEEPAAPPIDQEQVTHIVLYMDNTWVRTGLKSTWIYRAFLKSTWKLNLPWKVMENHSKALKSIWILLFSVGLSTVDIRDLNQYQIVVPLFGAAYAAPNIGTTLLY